MNPKTKTAFVTYFVCPMLALGLYTATASLTQAEAADDQTVSAQPEHERGPTHHPAMALFDADHDGVISSAEIDALPAKLRAFDFDTDGNLSVEELRQAMPPPRGMGGPGGHANMRDSRGPDERGGRGPGGPRGDQPPPPAPGGE